MKPVRVSALGIAMFSIALLGAACTKPSTTGNRNDGPDSNSDAVLSTNTTSGTSNADVTNSEIPVLRTAIVRLTADGGSPNDLTVQAGTVISFVNDDTTGHWIASDPHPVHTGLPGFDAGRSIAPGGSYEFTFGPTGRFTYHDHVDSTNTKFKGSITVQP